LDVGISERDFWKMTFAEVDRAVQCWQRTRKRDQQEKAMFVHILADLVGHSVARIYSQNATFPSITDAFPLLFETSEEEQKKQAEAAAEVSALRFMQFAKAHNKKKGGAKGN